MQSYLAQALRRAAQPIATRSIVGLQSRFIQLDPKLCFVQPAEVKDRMYELLKKFEVVDKEKLSAANHSAQFAELGLDSLDTVEFLLTVEDEFKVEIPDEDAENIKTIEDAIKYVALNSSAQ